MQTQETTGTVLLKENSPEKTKARAEEKFVPKGAIAFFIALVLLGLVIWYGIYFLMLERI